MFLHEERCTFEHRDSGPIKSKRGHSRCCLLNPARIQRPFFHEQGSSLESRDSISVYLELSNAVRFRHPRCREVTFLYQERRALKHCDSIPAKRESRNTIRLPNPDRGGPPLLDEQRPALEHSDPILKRRIAQELQLSHARCLQDPS